MEFLQVFFQGILDLGSTVFMPIVVTIIGIVAGMKPSKAFSAGLTLGVAIAGMSVVQSYMGTAAGDPVTGFVEATGIRPRPVLVPACATPLTRDGVEVWTNSARAMKARRTVLELLISDQPQNCLTCAKNQECELQKLAAEFGIREIEFQGQRNLFPVDESPAIMRDLTKCIMCRRCETMCNKFMTAGALSGVDTISGATISYNEFVEAVNNALNEASAAE